MDRQIITFRADDQVLVKLTGQDLFASNIVSYIDAQFDLGNNWNGFDAVRAVWSSATDTISTVLDAEGKCVVPAEVLRYPSRVLVSLVGSTSEGITLTGRLTTYAVVAFVIDKDTKLTGSETPAITPSQFEQFVGQVRGYVEAIGGDIVPIVNEWLDNHPEATTTVQDGSLTEAKFTDELKLKTIKDYVTPEMFGAKGDGVTDDTEAIQSAINSGKAVFIPEKTYLVTSTITIPNTCPEIKNVGVIHYSGTGYCFSLKATWNKTYYFGSIVAEATSSGCILLDASNGSIAYINIHFENLRCLNTTDGKCIFITQTTNYVNEIRFFGGWVHDGAYGFYCLNEPQSQQRGHYSWWHVGFEGVTTGVYLDNMLTSIAFFGCRMEESTTNMIETNPLRTSIWNRVYWYGGTLRPNFLTKCINFLVYIIGDSTSSGGVRFNQSLIYCNGCLYGISYDGIGSAILLPASYVSEEDNVATDNISSYFKSDSSNTRDRLIRTRTVSEGITEIDIAVSLNMFVPDGTSLRSSGNKFLIYVTVPPNGTVKFINEKDNATLYTKTSSSSSTSYWFFKLYYVIDYGLMIEFVDSANLKNSDSLT